MLASAHINGHRAFLMRSFLEKDEAGQFQLFRLFSLHSILDLLTFAFATKLSILNIIEYLDKCLDFI